MTRCVTLDSTADLKRIEEFLHNTSSALLYSGPTYLLLLNSYLSDTAFELWVSEDESGKITGYFPVCFKLNARLGAVCNSLPYYGSNGGIITLPGLSQDERNRIYHALLSAVSTSVRSKKCTSFTIITNPLDPGFSGWLKDNFRYDLTDERIGQLTPLPAASDQVGQELLQRFEDPRPRNIRKAEKENVQVYWTNKPEAYDFLFDTHTQNIRAIGGISKEKSFFEKVQQIIPENNRRVYVAERNNVRLGALLLFYYNQTVEYFTPAVVEEHRNLQASALLIFRAMCDAACMNYKWWNWGGTWLSQGGVFDFKRKWGTQSMPYYYYTQLNDQKILSSSKEDLLQQYPFFFVVPFHKLIPANQ
jgi:hypothetical protein